MASDATTTEVTELLERTGALRRGHFILSSGLHSDRYCQCAALFEHPIHGGRVAEIMCERLVDLEIDVVLAPALGGVLWGYELARTLGVRSIFAERAGPDREFSLRRGFALARGDRVLLAEDVVTTGGSILSLAPLVEAAGAEVVGVASVVDRSGGAFARRVGGLWFEALVRLESDTYHADEVPAELSAIPVESPGSRRKEP